MSLLKEIENRRSIRRFDPNHVISDDDLLSILEAGRRAPSGSNTQPARFVVVRDRKKIAELSKASLGQDCFSRCSCIIVCLANVKAKLQTEERLLQLAELGAFTTKEVDYFVGQLRQPAKAAMTAEENELLRKKINDRDIFSVEEIEYIQGMLDIDLKALNDKSKSVRDTAIAIYSMMLQATALGLGSCWVMIAKENIVKEQIKLEDNNYAFVAMLALGRAIETPKARPRMSLNEIAFVEQWGMPLKTALSGDERI